MAENNLIKKDDVAGLIEAAKSAQEKAYAPYSDFRVGAALLTASKDIYTGCNIENGSYGLTNCAERTAIFKAVSEGHREFRKLVIISDTDLPISPCGACRQVMVEFSPQMEVIMVSGDRQFEISTAQDLLPKSFKFAKG